MIIVNSPLMHAEIKEVLGEQTDPTFTFVKEDGIRLYFETSMDSDEEAAELAKKLIKERVGDLVMFKVRTEEYI